MGSAHVPGMALRNCWTIGSPVKIVLFANTDWYLYNYRMPLAQAIQKPGHEVIMLSPPGKYGHLLEQAGFRWIKFPLSRRGKNPIYELNTIWRLYRFYQREKPAAVQHFTVKCVIYGSLAARWAGIKEIINAIPGLGHVFIDNSWQGRLLRWLVKRMYKFALRNTRVIFQNPDDQALFLDESLVESTSQTLIKGSGVDMERFAILPEPHGTPLVVLPARLLWAKGVGEFVAAGQMLHDEGIDVRFALVGDSDPETAGAVPLSQLETWQRRGEVEWWGWQEDIISVFRQSHIVCLPSYYAEGVPRSLVEAAACSRPIISTDMPGCREIVHHGENGLLVPSKNITALAGAIRMLLLDPDLRQKMGARGREIAETDFSLEQVIRKNLELFGISAVDRGPG